MGSDDRPREKIMATKKAAATVVVKGKGINSGFILRIIIGLLFICLGIQGYVGGGDAMGVGDLYNALDSDALVYILATIVLLSGVILLVPMFIRGISEKIVRVGMIAVLIIWIAVIVFADFIGTNFGRVDWLVWIQMFLYHLVVLFGILQVCGKALK